MKLLFLQVAGYEMVCGLALNSIKIGKYHLEAVRFLLDIKALEGIAAEPVYCWNLRVACSCVVPTV